jgi:hypothetical protein
MSMQDQYELRVDMADWEGNTGYAVYDLFAVGDVVSNYLLAVDKYKGNAGNRYSHTINLKGIGNFYIFSFV